MTDPILAATGVEWAMEEGPAEEVSIGVADEMGAVVEIAPGSCTSWGCVS